ncbi:hypothetical protein GJU39_06350 [Pedobacter petrophilus]|uniref:XRE family transcriptional regulator n=1 Tax=Pedobacter petrophilus TaxID=1908241 RepID=A0A7K0FXC2_9SPHI|nr:hypothetical protein [Pedobacter petrophilus]MRX75704.1 hypothetical protein [Pedobacter petrophilus]
MEENDFVSIWLEETGNPAIAELTQRNLNLAGEAAAVLAERKIDLNALAIPLDINPEELNRWMQGRHSFSQKVLTEIAALIKN